MGALNFGILDALDISKNSIAYVYYVPQDTQIQAIFGIFQDPRYARSNYFLESRKLLVRRNFALSAFIIT